MTSSRHITGIIAAITALAVVLCLGAVLLLGGSDSGGGLAQEYETELFDTSDIITVNIIMDSDDWQDMLDNAIDETYYRCDVEVNGEVFYSVGIRPKGNTSLSTVYNDPTTERYSFKLEFDRYVSGQTCFGLDKLVLNNNYADATGMKEALVYDMFAFTGADASLYNYAKISINGEYWGLYLALEAVEDSFLLRNYGVQEGELYKPEGAVGGGFSQSGGGADLNYSDSSLSSYETIWDGAVTDSTDSDHRRVVTALEHAASGEDIENYMDIDALLRYMAVHEFCVNADSLSGNMAHNYYLYESGGALSLIPWDYNLAFGGMGMGDAQSVINDPIDSPFSGTEFFDRLLENEEYLAQYHEYLQKLSEEYVLGGGLDAFFERTHGLIDGLVETDPSAFYSYDEYTAACAMLQSTVTLRAQSVLGQLGGSIPSTDSAQRENAGALLSADGIDLSVMGQMNTGGPSGDGGGLPGFGGGFGNDDDSGFTPGEGGENGPGGDNSGSENGFDGSSGDFSPTDADGSQNGAPPELPSDGTQPASPEAAAASGGSDDSTASEGKNAAPGGTGSGEGEAPTGESIAPTSGSSSDGSSASDGESSAVSAPADGAPDGTSDESSEPGSGPAPSGGFPGTSAASNENGGFSPPDGFPGGQDSFPGGQGGFPGGQGGFPGGQGGFPGGDFPGAPGSGEADGTASENLFWLGISAAVMLAALVFVLLYRRRPRKR